MRDAPVRPRGRARRHLTHACARYVISVANARARWLQGERSASLGLAAQLGGLEAEPSTAALAGAVKVKAKKDKAATTKETLPGGPCVYDTIDNSVLYLDGPYKSAGVSFTRTRTELIGRRVLVCLARLSSQPSKIGAYRVGCYQRGEFIPDRYEQVLPCFCLSRRTVDVELDSIEKTLWHIAHTMGVEAKQRIVLAATRLATVHFAHAVPPTAVHACAVLCRCVRAKFLALWNLVWLGAFPVGVRHGLAVAPGLV